MEIKGIKYIAPFMDNSGYAEASRGNILALHKKGVPITLSPISFEKLRPDLGETGKILEDLVNKDIEYNVVIIHTTPEFWNKYREPNKVNVGYTVWETTRLHTDWPDYINNNVDKVLVGCDWNIEVFRDSGINIPIGVVPHGMSVDAFDNVTPYSIAGIDDDTFVFYAIMQWVERKDPLSLVKAYWYAFQKGENVALVLKTYRGDYSDGEKEAIKKTLSRLKNVTPMPNTHAKIYLILDMLTDSEIRGLHARGDCYTSLDRGEGFGIGPFHAGAMGNPIIVTGFGGVRQYAKKGNSYLVDYTLTPVYGMPWSPWYTGNQLWAQADVVHGSSLMQQVYNNREDAKIKGANIRKYIGSNFSWNVIGEKIVRELQDINIKE